MIGKIKTLTLPVPAYIIDKTIFNKAHINDEYFVMSMCQKEIIDILKSEDRTRAGKTANPEGLYLKNVFY